MILDGANLDQWLIRDGIHDPVSPQARCRWLLPKITYTVIASSLFDPMRSALVRNESVPYVLFRRWFTAQGKADGFRGVGTSDGIITDREIFDYVSDEMEKLFRTYPFLEEHRLMCVYCRWTCTNISLQIELGGV